MNLSSLILKLAGWKVQVNAPDYPKSIICVAPHTSNWDFVLGMLAYASVGRKAGFMMKENWFFFPMGAFFRALGGIPVPRKAKNKKGSMVEAMVKKFDDASQLTVAITPEGTRSRTAKWRTGFLQIAYQAHIPCLLGALDAKTKNIYVNDTFWPTGDMEADMKKIKEYYKHFTGINPKNFTTE